MALEALDHFTIQCSDMETTRDFYRDVLGLTEGIRPNLGFPGYWLYAGESPVVHLLGPANALPENRESKPGRDTNGLDHIALRGTNAQATIARLKKHGIAFRENMIADIQLHQIFVRDPNGIMIEMNFRN